MYNNECFLIRAMEQILNVFNSNNECFLIRAMEEIFSFGER